MTNAIKPYTNTTRATPPDVEARIIHEHRYLVDEAGPTEDAQRLARAFIVAVVATILIIIIVASFEIGFVAGWEAAAAIQAR